MSSVFGGQAVQVVAGFQNHPSVEKASLMSGYPLIHSGLVREKWHYGKQMSQISELIGKENFFTRRLMVPPVGVHPKKFQLGFFTAGHYRFLADHIRSHRVTIVQCRSYVATHVALEVRRLFGMNFKVIFDSRSLMPEEGVIMNRWDVDDVDFNFWKTREAQMLRDADLTTAVSSTIRAHYDKLGARSTKVIYLNVTAGNLDNQKMDNIQRVHARSPILTYCGFLDEETWHSPDNLWQIFRSFKAHCPGAKFLVITKSNHKKLKAGLSAHGYDDLLNNIEFTSAASPRETVHKLQNADIAVLSYRTPENVFEEYLANSVFATKSAEYLSVGLPVIVNRFCGGAREYISSNDAGFSYDPTSLLTASDVNQLLQQATQRRRISESSRSDFDLNENVDRLVKAFQKL